MVAGWIFSAELDQVAPALVKAQSGLEPIRKEHTANAGRARYSYAKIEDVVRQTLPIVNRAGLFVGQSQDPEIGPDVVIYTLLMHVSGQYAITACRVPTDRQAGPQGTGSAHTYARRYALLAALGIAAEDDDGKPRMRTPEPRPEPRPEAPPPEPKTERPAREAFRRCWFYRLNSYGFARLEDAERQELQRRMFGYAHLADIPDGEVNAKLAKLKASPETTLKPLISAKLREIRGGQQ